MRLTLPIAFALMLALPGCSVTRQAKSIVAGIPRPVLPSFDPPAYDAPTEAILEYCKAVDARFEYGRRLVGEGNELLEQGRELVSEGSYEIRRGEARVTAAETMLAGTRRELGLKTGNTEPTFTDVKELYDPELLTTIRARFENGIRAMERAKDVVGEGERKVARGRGYMDRGIDLLRQGQDAMQDDEGRCRDLDY